MSSNSVLRITDCLTTINFLRVDNGFLICEWVPTVAQLKNGGVWQSSPLVDGKRLASRNFENAIETFTLTIKGASQNEVIDFIQTLTTMLEKAQAYWTTAWQKQPVWLEARGPTETNIRYAVIKGYKLEEIANPFSQPFFGNCKSLISKFILVIERDHWLDQIPGTAHRIEINNLQSYPTSTMGYDVSTCSQSADDAIFYEYASVPSRGIDLTAFNNIIGSTYYPPLSARSNLTGLRFPSVSVPQGATITNAYLALTVAASAGAEEDYPLTVFINGQKHANASIFTVEDWYTKGLYTRTLANLTFVSPPHSWCNPSLVYNILGLDGIIQEIVNQNAWVSGNALVLYLNGYPSGPYLTNYRAFGSFDGSQPPSLIISYSLPTTIETAGHEDTDTGKVYIANRHVQAQLTHVFINSGGFLGNLVGTALPWTLLPANPSDGDEIYFGVADDVSSFGPINNLAFDISQAAAGFTLNWEYSNSSGGWTSALDYSDKSVNLDETGEYAVHIITINPGAIAVNGVTGYWIRATVENSAGGTTPPIQQNRTVYSVVTPFVDVGAENIKGEIPALARIRIESIPAFGDYITDVVIGSRSKSRGENFSAYLNFSDVQMPSGVSVLGSLMDEPNSPTGRCCYYTDTVERDDFLETGPWLSIDNTLSSQYQGMFHAYLRINQLTGDYGDFDLRLKYYINVTQGATYSSPVRVPVGGVGRFAYVLDCGIINLGTMALGYDDNLGTIGLAVELRHNVDTSTTIELFDLILVPCDEWFGAFKCPVRGASDNTLAVGRILDVDAAGNPRTSRAMLRMNNEDDVGELNEQFVIEYIKMTRGGPFLQTNSDQRLWFTVFFDTQASNSDSVLRTTTDLIYDIRSYVVNRYLTMRGAL